MRRILAFILPVIAALPALAEEAAEPARDAARNAPDTVGTIMSLGVGLLAVVAVIYGCAWLIRRMSGLTGMNNSAIKVVSVLAIGARERIALVEVGGQQILLGITPSTIRTLQVFDEPVVDAANPPSSEFARRLQGMIGKSWSASERKD
ncbi:MAG: flagellar biosynthetic protein FliO [Marinobacter excellens HL-55]|uniref:Flagellar protein n=1 Tax=Marinobacter excellens HL-55 TaxID=1305731 RepID=A0A0P8B801_9GAMM|nr:MAG: flagellar biosynthetic protein FliO [Marinobacter excellens HL-55]